MLAIAIGIIKVISKTNTLNNLYLSVVIAFVTACWVVLAIPWFYIEQPRKSQILVKYHLEWFQTIAIHNETDFQATTNTPIPGGQFHDQRHRN